MLRCNVPNCGARGVFVAHKCHHHALEKQGLDYGGTRRWLDEVRSELRMLKDSASGNSPTLASICFDDAELEDVDGFANFLIKESSFVHATGLRVSFNHARLIDCDLTASLFRKCTFRNAVFESCWLHDMVFVESDLTNAKIQGDVEDVLFTKNCKLSGLEIADSCINSLTLPPTIELAGAKFHGIEIVNSVLTDLDLTRSDLDSVTIGGDSDITGLKLLTRHRNVLRLVGPCAEHESSIKYYEKPLPPIGTRTAKTPISVARGVSLAIADLGFGRALHQLLGLSGLACLLGAGYAAINDSQNDFRSFSLGSAVALGLLGTLCAPRILKDAYDRIAAARNPTPLDISDIRELA